MYVPGRVHRSAEINITWSHFAFGIFLPTDTVGTVCRTESEADHKHAIIFTPYDIYLREVVICRVHVQCSNIVGRSNERETSSCIAHVHECRLHDNKNCVQLGVHLRIY